ncbi:hypothetical protein [uncultured Pseudodesulfovibrio sp.]|uniref:hypothetical protein n=1 Tax=uncultured Pseudodesulfovibrio sp. TaxID=2035858 RepID=UPI0029C85B6A|nr:hypothetical protein [uncultured Pseudodesulfovibrio sp.]
MAIHYEIFREDGYLRIVTTGTLRTIEELIAYGTFMYDQATSLQIPRILLDEDKMDDAADASTIYEWCEHEVVSKTATAGIRIAGICTAENYACNKVFETMLQNRSYNYKVFQDEQEAIKWLTS